MKKEARITGGFLGRLPFRLQRKLLDIRLFWASGASTTKIAFTGLVFNLIAFGLLVYLLITRLAGGDVPRWALFLACFIGIIETVLGIQSIMGMLHNYDRRMALERSVVDMETLNRSLRTQRHDFKNHMQVISALLEMGEAQEAKEYLEDVQDDFQVLSRALRTSEPAVNALLQAKQSDCLQAGIAFEMEINTPLDGLPMEAWQFCRVLGNLIDNAVEAMTEGNTQNGSILVHLSEEQYSYQVRVENNGPYIPEKDRYRIFRAGFSTKGDSRGLGLSIVRDLVQQAGGTVGAQSNELSTCFALMLPKAVRPVEREV